MLFYVFWTGFIVLVEAMICYLFPRLWFQMDMGEMPYSAWMVTLTITTFVVYGLDKVLAITRVGIRVPDDLLHLLALLGGFVGGLLGMFFFNHKTSSKERPVFLGCIFLGFLMHATSVALLISWNGQNFK